MITCQQPVAAYFQDGCGMCDHSGNGIEWFQQLGVLKHVETALEDVTNLVDCRSGGQDPSSIAEPYWI